MRERRWSTGYRRLVMVATALVLVLPVLLYIQHSAAARRASVGGPGGKDSHAAAAAAALATLVRENTKLVSELLAANATAARSEVPAAVRARASAPPGAAGLASASSASPGEGIGGGSVTAATPWLRIALLSVGRSSGAEYLLHTLRALLHCRPALATDPLRASVEIAVVNNQVPPEEHTVLQRAREIFGRRVRFITKVKPKVFQQTCDLVLALRSLADLPPARHVLLMEDDWLLCPNGLLAVAYAVDKAYAYDPHWLALRVSYGFNGLVMHGAELPSLASHLGAHPSRRPPDHLLFEWFSGERPDTAAFARGRSYRIFRHNLFYHIGAVSTLNQPAKRFTPGCYSQLYDWLLPAEVFNDKDCPHDDLWPCQEAAALGSLALFSAPTGAPAGSAARLQWSAPDWSSVSLTPTPLATSPILPDRDLSDEQLQPVQGQGEAAGVGAGGGAEAGYSSAGGSAAASGITGGGHGGGGGGDVDVGGGGSRVLMGERAESCADACARVGLRCSLSTLRELNSCDALRRHYACPSGCEDSIGEDQPAQVAVDAPASFKPGTCLVTSERLDCHGSHTHTSRLCACDPPGKS